MAEAERRNDSVRVEDLGRAGTLDEVENALQRRRWILRAMVGLLVAAGLLAAATLLLPRRTGSRVVTPLTVDPQDQYLRAQVLEGRGRIDDAMAAYRKALEAPGPWVQREACARHLADLAYTMGMQRSDLATVREARVRYEQLATGGTGDEDMGEALFRAATCALTLGQYADAVELYTAFVKRFPETEHLDEAHLGLSRAAIGRRDRATATACFRLLLEVDPEDGVAAATLYELGRGFLGEAEDCR